MTPTISNDSSLIDSRRAWLVALVSFLVIAVSGGANYIAVVALKPIASEFDWPRSIPALCYSFAMIGMGLGGIFMGRWSDRVGVAVPAAVGIVMLGAGAWLAGVSENRWQLWLAHGLLLGFIGNGAVFAPLLANTTHWFQRRRGIAVAVVMSGQALSGTLWPPLLRYGVDSYGWRETFFAFAVIVIVLALPLTLLLRQRRPGYQPPVQTGINTATADLAQQSDGKVMGWSANLVLMLLCMAIIGCCVAMAMPMVHIVAHATDLGYASARAAELLTILLGCSIISRLVWGVIADRIGGLLTLFYGSLCQAVILFAFTLVDTLPGLYLVAALFGLGYGGIVPSYPLIIREHFPLEGIGWRVGTVVLYGTVGMALGGWLGAFIFDLTQSYNIAFLVGVGFNIINLIIIALLVLRQSRARPPLLSSRPA